MNYFDSLKLIHVLKVKEKYFETIKILFYNKYISNDLNHLFI